MKRTAGTGGPAGADGRGGPAPASGTSTANATAFASASGTGSQMRSRSPAAAKPRPRLGGSSGSAPARIAPHWVRLASGSGGPAGTTGCRPARGGAMPHPCAPASPGSGSRRKVG